MTTTQNATTDTAVDWRYLQNLRTSQQATRDALWVLSFGAGTEVTEAIVRPRRLAELITARALIRTEDGRLVVGTSPRMYRVTYTRTGEGRRTKLMTEDDLRWYEGAWYCGIRVTSYRRAEA